MKKRLIAALLLSLHLAFVLLSEVQIWQYLYLISGAEQTQTLNFSNDQKRPLTGDITYLSALIKRSGEEHEKDEKKTDIPETTISHTGLIYLPVETNINIIISKQLGSKYFHYATNLIFYPKKVNTPPPKVTFS
jgi:hypothetical protein